MELSLRLARYFSTAADFWVHLQVEHDLERTRHSVGELLPRDVDGDDMTGPATVDQAALARMLRERVAAASVGGSESSRARHVARGKLLPRDRVARLLDEGSPFLEVSPLAADGLYGGEAPAAGVIAGKAAKPSSCA